MLVVGSNSESSEQDRGSESQQELLSLKQPDSVNKSSDEQVGAGNKTYVVDHEDQPMGRTAPEIRQAMDEAKICMEKAHLLMEDCISKATFKDLDCSILLLRQVIQTHGFHLNGMESLAYALSMRCVYRNQAIDLEESLGLYHKILDKSNENPDAPDQEDDRELINTAKGSLSNFTMSISSNSLDIIVSYLQTSLAILRPREFPDYSWALNHLILAMYSRFQHSKATSHLDDVIFCIQNGLEYERNKSFERPRMLQLLCCVLIARFASTGDASDLKKASNLFKDESDFTSAIFTANDPAQQVEIVHDLRKQIKEGSLDDFDEAIYHFRQTILRIPVDHDDYPVTLISLAAVLIARSKGGSVEYYIDQAIMLNKRALEFLPIEHTSRAHAILNLAVALQIRSEQKHQRDDLNEAITILRAGLAALGTLHPDRSRFLHSLAASLEMQFEHAAELRYLNEAVLLYRQAVQSLTQSDAKRPTSLNNLAAALQIRFNQVGQRSDMEEAIVLRKEIVEHFPRAPFDPNHLAHLVRLIAALQTLFQHTRERDDVDEVISALRSTFEYLPESHEMRAEILFHLADNLASRFQMTQQQNDLEEEILTHRQFLQLCESDDPNRSKTFNNLGCALSNRFDLLNQKIDLDEAIYFHREALKLRAPPHPDWLASLINLASSLECRFQHAGERVDLDEAISLNKTAANVPDAPHSRRATVLNNLANALETSFEQIGQLEDLNQSIVLHKEALELRPKPHPDRPSSLNNLGHALQTRFKHTGQRSDLDAAIQIHRDALELHGPPHPNRSYSLDNLAITLTDRFEHTGQRGDLEEAVLLHREALNLRTPSHSDRSLTLNNLAYTLQARFKILSQQEDLNQAIILHRAALELRGGNHPSRHMSLNNLANALMAQFDTTGQLDDLNQATALHKEALDRRVAPHPDRASSLMNLASAFGTHFAQTGQRRSLDEAILCYREALEIFPNSHPLRSTCLNNLANRLITARRGNEIPGQQDTIVEEAISLVTEALTLRSPPHPDWSLSVFHLSGLLEAQCENLPAADRYNFLDKAIILCEGAFDLLPAHHVHRQAYVGRLASLLDARFKTTGRKEDIDQAILLQRQELASQGTSHPDRVIFLTNLAGALQTRFYRADHNQSDFEESISLNKQALDVYPTQHPGRFTCFTNLGNVFHHAYTLLGDPRYLEESFASFALAMKCPSKRPSSWFNTATLWSDYADKYHHDSALVAYGMALRCLTEMTSFSLDIYKRQNLLRSASDGLARKAAQSAIAHAHLEEAIIFLEQGRAIFWSQVLHLRSPLDKLQNTAPELANKLQTIAAELERGSYRNTVDTLGVESKISLEMEASRFRRLDEDWRNCLKQARNLEGFEDFLQPPGIVSLKAAAGETPIVFLLPNEQHSDCLILTSAGIHHIPLMDVSVKILRNLVDMIDFSTVRSTAPRSLFEDTNIEDVLDIVTEEPAVSETQRSTGAFNRRTRRSRPSTNSIFEYVLKTLWFDVVKPIIDFLGLQKSNFPPILQWCPTGIFTFLPLHAAGCYNIDNTSKDCASDFIVSSYTPTAALLLPRQDTPSSSHPFKMMTVVDSNLPFASDELTRIKTQIASDGECLVELGIANNPATIEIISSNLQTASMVHFACHGIQDQINPLDSALFVDDGKLSISKIMQFQPPNGSLAFLCACETGMGDAKIPDESMSLGASLLFSGYRSVVATMWKMTDADGPMISEAFYEHLFRGPDGTRASRPDIRKSARALHAAVQKLRSSGVEFRRWMPFVHLGRGD